MENFSGVNTNDELMELPPGFRFHPTDEELITHYLSPKVLDSSFSSKAIGEVDLNKVEPWDLPWKAKIGEKEWYFFCLRDRKYPTGLRTNRATDAGYWKATGKDKEIFRAKVLVGMKKTLVFYRGRAPRGQKTNWVMHEYRLEGKHSMHNLSKSIKNEWAICRIFKKSSGGKKVHISGLMGSKNCGADSQSSELPPLMDLSADENHTRIRITTTEAAEGSYVTCFSNPTKDPRQFADEFISRNSDFSSFPFTFPNISTLNSLSSSQIIPCAPVLNQAVKAEFSQDDMSSAMSYNEMGFGSYEDREFPVVSTAAVDLDCLWNY